MGRLWKRANTLAVTTSSTSATSMTQSTLLDEFLARVSVLRKCGQWWNCRVCPRSSRGRGLARGGEARILIVPVRFSAYYRADETTIQERLWLLKWATNFHRGPSAS